MGSFYDTPSGKLNTYLFLKIEEKFNELYLYCELYWAE